MLRVLGRASSINVRKVLWTCAEIGLPFEREDWGSGFRSPNEPAFTALNPNAMIPVVIEGHFVLWESNTICRWLAAEQGRDDLLPGAPRERALVERWMDWTAGDLNTAWRPAFMGLVRKSAKFQDPAVIAAGAAEWNRMMEILDRQLLCTGAHVCGDGFTLADVVLGLATHRWYATPIERPALLAVRAWYERLRARPAFIAQGHPEHP
jgi:glutathione S-transferase